MEIAISNLFKQFVAILTIEGRKPCDHFVKQRAKAPPIDRTTVTLSVQNFRSEIFRRTAKAVGATGTVGDPFLGQSKVGETNVTLGVEQYIFWFQISVHNVEAMHVAESKYDFRGIKARSFLSELPQLAEMEEEFSTSTVVQDEVQLVLGLKCHVHSDDEGVLDVTEHATFGVGVFHLVSLNDVVFAQDFQSVNFTRFDLFDQKYFSCDCVGTTKWRMRQ